MRKNEAELEIPCYMTDCRYRLRAASFMKLAQVMAMEGSRSLGFGYDVLDKEHKAWILYRMQFKFLRPVMWRENVIMKTWHRGQEGIVFLRDYEMSGQDGKLSVIGTSSWIVLDTQERTFVRNANLPDCISIAPQSTDSVYGFPAQRVILPRNAELAYAGSHSVSYSDVDFIGHTNNAKYVEWAMDSIEQNYVSNHQIKEVTVNFNNEAKLGDKVDIFCCEDKSLSPGTFYVEGKIDGRQSFAVKLVF